MRKPAICLLRVEQLEGRETPAAAFDTLPIVPTDDPAVLDNVRAIAAFGQQLGRRSDAFIRVGDSNSATGIFIAGAYLDPLGAPGYNPDRSALTTIDAGLLDTLAAFSTPVDATGANSFTRTSSSAYPGWTLLNVLPTLAGETAATDAGVALVMIGTNDTVRYSNAELYRALLQQLVTTLTTSGVVPVLSTIPDRTDNPIFSALARQFNQVIADVGEQYRVPVWNLNRGLASLPNQGLQGDGVHLSYSPNGGGQFMAADLTYGQNLRNLEALQVLDWFRTRVNSAASVDPLPTLPILVPLPTLPQLPQVIAEPPVVVVETAELPDQFLAVESSSAGGVRLAFADVTATTDAGQSPLVAPTNQDEFEPSVRPEPTPPTDRESMGMTVYQKNDDGSDILVEDW